MVRTKEHNPTTSRRVSAPTARGRILVLLFSVVLFLNGCDNDPNPPPYRSKRPDGAPWLVTYRAFGDDPRSLDPQFTYDEVSHSITSSVYDTFLTYEPFREDFVLMPELGAELPVLEQNADGTSSYTCKIKPGIRFADDPSFPDGKGRELTSRDFVYAFQRMADPKVECPIASNLGEFLVGMQDVWDAAQKTGTFDYDAPFPAVQEVDRYTFKINLKKPYPQIRYWLAFPFTTPVPRESVEYYDGKVHDGVQRDQFRFHPVGTGAFRLAEWTRGSLIRLVRNENYDVMRFPESGWPEELADRYLPHAGKKLPLLDEVQLIIMRESIPAWILFKQGWTDSSGVGKDVFASVITVDKDLTPEYRERKIELNKEIELSTSYVMFNMQDALIGTNKKLRQAMSTVFDSKTANEIFFSGIFLEAQQLLPPGMIGADENFANPYRTNDLEKAKALLAEAGYPNAIDPKTGRPLEISLDTAAESGASRQLTEYEKTQFEKLGLRVNIVENTFTQILDKQTRGGFQFLFAGWNADYPDPENYFFLFYGPNIPPRGYNQSRFQNPEFDKLFEQMATMEDSPDRSGIIKRMNDILTEESVIIPLFTPVRFSLLQPWAKRLVINPLVSKSTGFKYTWVDAELRAEERKKLNKKNYWPLVVAGLVLFMVIAYAVQRRSQANV